MLHRLPSPAALVLLLGLAGAGRAAPADSGRLPDAAAAAAAMRTAAPLLAARAARWEAQVAPSFTTAPATDAERTWTALDGWVKVPVGGDDGPAVTPLPDPWKPNGRDYQKAWYVLRADFGDRLPESLVLRFDAVAHQCEVFVNGVPVGHHLGGYTPFSFDITRAAHPGLNVIALWVWDEHAAMADHGRAAISQVGVTYWGRDNLISIAGICGGVYFDARPAVHADHLLIHTSTRKNEIDVTTWLAAPAPAGARISQAVYAWPAGASPVLRLPDSTVGPAETSAHVTMPWADARRWSPEHPNLYVLRTTVTAGGKSETVETRFGFREFWTEGKSFILNGTPIRLLGVSIAHDEDIQIAGNPRGGRAYVRDVLAFDKRVFNYQAIRLHASIHPPEAIQAADEVGFLCIDQSSVWSAMGAFYNRDPAELLRNLRPQYAEWFWRDANNPSVVIFDVENEQIRGPGSRTPERERWVLALDRFILDLDPTRIIEHAGAAWYSPTQQDIHVHMQQEYNHVLASWSEQGRVPLILGEFWVGGSAGETRLTDGHEYVSQKDYYQDEAGLYRDRILEARSYGASGIMPFWMDDVILGRTMDTHLVRNYQPGKKRLFFWRFPGLQNLGAQALSPVLAFAWPRGDSAVRGRTFQRDIVTCNDLEETRTFTVACAYGGQRQQWQVILAPAAQDRHPVVFTAEDSGPLEVTVAEASGKSWQGDTLAIHPIAPRLEAAPRLSRELVVVPAPSAAGAAALQELGLPFRAASSLPADPARTLVVVPPDSAPDALGQDADAVRAYLAAGGRLLVLDQHERPVWLPMDLPFRPATDRSVPEFGQLGWPEYTRYRRFSRIVPVYAPSHPLFDGMVAGDFSWWQPDDGRVADDVYARPGAMGLRAGAPYRVLVGASERNQASVVECRIGDGTAIFCQAEALEAARSSPAARAFLMNVLRYLDGPGWQASESQVGYAGRVSPARLASLIDLPKEAFVPADGSASVPPLVLAADGADVGLLDRLTRSGHTVVVLSAETSGRLPGYTVAATAGARYAGTRGGAAEEPLFWGVATGSFLPLEESPVNGGFRRYPSGARVVLGGLSSVHYRHYGKGHLQPIDALDADAPVAVEENFGRGRLIATTIEPWQPAVECDRQLLTTIVANAGVRVRNAEGNLAGVLVKATVPVRIDGRLDDWTNDLEDRNVSPYQHAEPIALTGHDRAAGFTRADEFSAVFYLLHDGNNLYVAGIVFSNDGGAQAQFDLGGRNLDIDLHKRSMALDGAPVAGGRVAFGREPAHRVFDTRLLAVPETQEGATFEASIPWSALGYSAPPAGLTGIFRLRNGGVLLQVPTAPEGIKLEPMALRIEP